MTSIELNPQEHQATLDAVRYYMKHNISPEVHLAASKALTALTKRQERGNYSLTINNQILPLLRVALLTGEKQNPVCKEVFGRLPEKS
ncbi:MAG TPA: hypothetical protein V6C82_06255 [Chroococcales cyanobacterium]|jgi:hypothetical protein